MGCAIANVIYGIPLTEELHEQFRSCKEDAEQYFETLYSASSDWTPGYCGVELDSIQEFRITALKDVTDVPTAEQEEEAHRLCAQLPDRIREVALPIGVYIVWSSR